MRHITINPNILQTETDILLKSVARYRKRLVFDTSKAADDFHAGVFGFKRFMAEFVKDLSAETNGSLIDAMNDRNAALLARGKAVMDHSNPDDVHAWNKVITLCYVRYEDSDGVPFIKRSHQQEAARSALQSYFEASLQVFSLEMKSKGLEHGVPYLEDLSHYIHATLASKPTLFAVEKGAKAAPFIR